MTRMFLSKAASTSGRSAALRTKACLAAMEECLQLLAHRDIPLRAATVSSASAKMFAAVVHSGLTGSGLRTPCVCSQHGSGQIGMVSLSILTAKMSACLSNLREIHPKHTAHMRSSMPAAYRSR